MLASVDITGWTYNVNGKQLEAAVTTNAPVVFVKAQLFWSGSSLLKELTLGTVKMWHEHNAGSPSGAQPSGTILTLENTTLTASENLLLKFDADVRTNVSQLLLELADGSTLFVKLGEGYARGTLDYRLTDAGTLIQTVPATNATIYLVPNGFVISDSSLLHQLPYQGNVNLDADGNDSRCALQAYTTVQYYYDANNDGRNAITEQLVYAVQTDGQGCYAFNVPEGSFDVYT